MASALAEDRPLVLHVRTVTGFGGGPEKTILNSPRFLEGLGYDCHCMYLHPKGDTGLERLEERAKAVSAPLQLMEDGGQFDLSVIGKLADYCQRHRVDIWHAHDDKTNALGLAVRRRYRTLKLVTTCHGWVAKPTWKTNLHSLISKSCLPFYDFVICVSPDLEEVARRWRVRSQRRAMIQNAIDTHDFRRHMTPVEAREQLEFPVGSRRLAVALGRLEEEKGFDVLIRAMKRLSDRDVDLTLFIAGEGSQREDLQGLVEELELTQRIRLLGQVADPRTLLQAADLFVLSSYREGLPNVLLEAMALETPSVCTSLPGVLRVVEHNQNGFLVNAGKEEELAEGIFQLANDTELAVTLAKAGRATIEREFSFQVRMQRIADIYDRVLGREKA